MKALMILLTIASLNALATDHNNYEEKCVTFKGTGAKKTFLTLHELTQGIGAVSLEESKLGDTSISTENIFCRVYKVDLGDYSKARKTLQALPDSKFECGYFISIEGNLSACSDPVR